MDFAPAEHVKHSTEQTTLAVGARTLPHTGDHFHGVFPFLGAVFLFAAVSCLFMASLQPVKLPPHRSEGARCDTKTNDRRPWSLRLKLAAGGVSMLLAALLTLACGVI